MDTDLRDRLERSFGDGPAHPPLEEQLAAGHRALRRRRVVSALAACGVAVVLGTAYAVASSGPIRDAGGQVAVEPTPTASPTTDPSPSEPPWEDDLPVRYVDGRLQIRPGTTVHERIANPYDYQPPDRSVALDVTYDGERLWVLADDRAEGPSTSSTPPSNGWASFADWVADQVGTAAPGEDGWPETVRLDQQGRVVAAPGADVVQRTDDPRLGADFAAPGEPTGAALVTVEGEKPSYFVVWRVVDGELDVITTPPGDVVGMSFEELLTYARAQYASGEGLR